MAVFQGEPSEDFLDQCAKDWTDLSNEYAVGHAKGYSNFTEGFKF